jgi:hypothetical protein
VETRVRPRPPAALWRPAVLTAPLPYFRYQNVPAVPLCLLGCERAGTTNELPASFQAVKPHGPSVHPSTPIPAVCGQPAPTECRRHSTEPRARTCSERRTQCATPDSLAARESRQECALVPLALLAHVHHSACLFRLLSRREVCDVDLGNALLPLKIAGQMSTMASSPFSSMPQYTGHVNGGEAQVSARGNRSHAPTCGGKLL